MATSKSGTLTANTVKSETVEVVAFGTEKGLSVTNRSTTGEIWVRLDGVDPTVAGDNCKLVIGTRSFALSDGISSVTVKMISTDALSYCVEGRDFI